MFMLLRPHQWVRGRWPWGYGSVLSIIIITVASAPDNLSLKQDGETTIVITWTTPTPLGDTTGYRVDYTTDSNTAVSDASTSTISLTSLEPGHQYSISVFGLSEHLPSEPVTSSIFLCTLLHQITLHVVYFVPL